jgi:hypothetical protein
VVIATQPPEAVPQDSYDQRWDPVDLELMEAKNVCQKHRMMSVLLLFAGLVLGTVMARFIDDPEALVFDVARVLLYGGMVWLVLNELRYLWHQRKLLRD